jgi:hypothetical protein
MVDSNAAVTPSRAADVTAAMPDAKLTGTAADVSANPPTAANSSLITAIMTLWLGLRQRLYSQLQLLTLETQRAAQSLVNMLILALFAALLLISCWLSLLSVGVLLLKSAGLSTLAALGCVLLLNFLALLTCLKLIRRQSSYLCFPASMALLKPKAPDTGPASDE